MKKLDISKKIEDMSLNEVADLWTRYKRNEDYFADAWNLTAEDQYVYDNAYKAEQIILAALQNGCVIVDPNEQKQVKIGASFVKENAVDEGYLSDWYQASVEDPWPDKYVEEVAEDFYLIPKEVVDKNICLSKESEQIESPQISSKNLSLLNKNGIDDAELNRFYDYFVNWYTNWGNSSDKEPWPEDYWENFYMIPKELADKDLQQVKNSQFLQNLTEKLDSLHSKILHSKLAEEITEAELEALVFCKTRGNVANDLEADYEEERE